MANGQQEQQQLPQVGTAQKPSLYQFLGSMSPEEHMKFKAFMHKRKGQQEITRNVGGTRAAELISDVESGELTIDDAVDRSKAELTPAMKLIDQQFFKPDITSSSMLILKERTGGNWTRTERNLWMSHYNTIKARENKLDVEEGRMTKRDASNAKIAENALVKYNELEGAVDTALKGHFKTDKYGNILPDKEGARVVDWARDKEGGIIYKTVKDEDGTEKRVKVPSMDQEDLDMLTKKWNYITSEVDKDVNPATYGQGNQYGMTQALWVVANLVPVSFLKSKKGIMVGDEFINLYKEEYDEPTMRRLYFDKLLSLLVKGKGLTADIDLGAPVTEETDEFSKYIIE